jgi:hypothetical protein
VLDDTVLLSASRTKERIKNMSKPENKLIAYSFDSSKAMLLFNKISQ